MLYKEREEILDTPSIPWRCGCKTWSVFWQEVWNARSNGMSFLCTPHWTILCCYKSWWQSMLLSSIVVMSGSLTAQDVTQSVVERRISLVTSAQNKYISIYFEWQMFSCGHMFVNNFIKIKRFIPVPDYLYKYVKYRVKVHIYSWFSLKTP